MRKILIGILALMLFSACSTYKTKEKLFGVYRTEAHLLLKKYELYSKNIDSDRFINYEGGKEVVIIEDTIYLEEIYTFKDFKEKKFVHVDKRDSLNLGLNEYIVEDVKYYILDGSKTIQVNKFKYKKVLNDFRPQ